MKVYFSPKGGCAAALVAIINKLKAGDALHCQYYSLTHPDVIGAIVKVAGRGVAVIAILDKAYPTEAPQAWQAFTNVPNLTPYVDAVHAIAHNKLAIALKGFNSGGGFVSGTVVGGSYNPTKQAESSNAENLTVETTRAIVSQYEGNFQHHLTHSTPLPIYTPQAHTKALARIARKLMLKHNLSTK
jgi:hypothetical protein